MKTGERRRQQPNTQNEKKNFSWCHNRVVVKWFRDCMMPVIAYHSHSYDACYYTEVFKDS